MRDNKKINQIINSMFLARYQQVIMVFYITHVGIVPR